MSTWTQEIAFFVQRYSLFIHLYICTIIVFSNKRCHITIWRGHVAGYLRHINRINLLST